MCLRYHFLPRFWPCFSHCHPNSLRVDSLPCPFRDQSPPPPPPPRSAANVTRPRRQCETHRRFSLEPPLSSHPPSPLTSLSREFDGSLSLSPASRCTLLPPPPSHRQRRRRRSALQVNPLTLSLSLSFRFCSEYLL